MKRFIILAILLLSSCGAYNRLPLETQKDSISVVVKESIIFRDSIVYVEVPAEKDMAILADTDTSRLETSIAKSEAWVTNGRLNHTLSNKPDVRLAKVVTIPVYLRSEESKTLAQKVFVKEVEVEKDLSAWQSFRIVLGTIALIIILLWGCLKLLKRLI